MAAPLFDLLHQETLGVTNLPNRQYFKPSQLRLADLGHQRAPHVTGAAPACATRGLSAIGRYHSPINGHVT